MAVFASEVRRLSAPLSEGLRVRHIAHFGLHTCDERDEPAEVLKRDDLADFDQIPTTNAGKIVGVLERDSGIQRKLDDSLLVSADDSLPGFITSLERQSYRLVLDGTGIKGIVTRSDLLKPPVLVLAYSLIAQLEILMNNAIERKYSDSDAWLSLLPSQAQKLIDARKRKLRAQNLLLSGIELADFTHKAKIVRRCLPAERDFAVDLEKLKKLRDDVAHVHEIVRTGAELHSLVDRLETATLWINALSRLEESGRGELVQKAHA